MNVQKMNDNSSTALPRHSANQRQPPTGKKDSSGQHYEPSQRGQSKRRPAPLQQSQNSRKLSANEEQPPGNNMKHRSDIAIIKNSDLQHLKSGLKGFQKEAPKAVENESIFGLINNQSNNDSEFAGLVVSKQQSQVVKQSQPMAELRELVTQHSVQPNITTDLNNQSNYNNFQNNKAFSNQHSISIVGSNNLSQNPMTDKDIKRRQYQEELQRQIRERDEIRKRESDDKERKFGSLARQTENPAPNQTNQTGFFPFGQRQSQDPQNEHQFMSSDKNLSNKLSEINREGQQMNTFYQPNNDIHRATMYQNAGQTKIDFPQIHTRGRVVENRIDFELESRGTIFQGRDEKSILIKKKEETQYAIKEALQKQIDEKNRKKEEEKQKEIQHNMREEQRLKNEVPYEPVSTFGRKTHYNNNHQHSIVGSGIARQDSMVTDNDIRSPTNQKNQTLTNIHAIMEEPEEPLISQPKQPSSEQIIREAEHFDNKNKQINDLSEMVKVLLEEQRSLKEKLENQEMKMNQLNDKEPSEPAVLVRKNTAITKKASERVRSQNPPKKGIQSADNKNIHARKMKEQHAIEQAKLEAIEGKIEKARRRIEEAKNQKSVKAQQTVMKLNKNENINDVLYGDEEEAPQHVPVIGGRHKSTAAQNNSQIGAQKTSYQAQALILQNNKHGLPPVAANRNIPSKGQKAPRGTSNKASSQYLPLTTIDQNNVDQDFGEEEEQELGARYRQNQSKADMSPQNMGGSPKKSRLAVNNSKLINANGEITYNLDGQGVSQLQYPSQEGHFFSPNIAGSATKKMVSPLRQDNFDNRMSYMGSSQQNYQLAYDPSRYQPAYSQQNHIRGKQNAELYMQDPQNDMYYAANTHDNFKNPSTAAQSYLQGLGGYTGAHLTSGGGIGMGKIPSDSFDLDIMMPPDIASIDNDISKPYQFTQIDKLNAMTPNPINNNAIGWGFDNITYNMPYVNEFSATKQSQNYNQNLNYGAISQFDDSQSIYDSKYSPSRGGAGGTQYSRDMYGTKTNNRFYDQ